MTAMRTGGSVPSGHRMTSLFCRHNRFTADCPICSKGTVLSGDAGERTRAPKPAATRPKAKPSTRAAAAAPRYPHVSVGPIEHEGRIYEVRFEQVPGGLRLGQWRGGELERRAVVLPATSLRELVGDARGRGFVAFDIPEGPGGPGDDIAMSPGRAGDMNDELRLERVGGGFVRVARWIFWPGTGVGWALQEAPVMLPEKRYEQVLSDAAAKGLL